MPTQICFYLMSQSLHSRVIPPQSQSCPQQAGLQRRCQPLSFHCQFVQSKASPVKIWPTLTHFVTVCPIVKFHAHGDNGAKKSSTKLILSGLSLISDKLPSKSFPATVPFLVLVPFFWFQVYSLLPIWGSRSTICWHGFHFCWSFLTFLLWFSFSLAASVSGFLIPYLSQIGRGRDRKLWPWNIYQGGTPIWKRNWN